MFYVQYKFTSSNYELTLKHNHSYTISAGDSADGNLTRINNALSQISLIELLEKFETNIKRIEQEMENAKEQLQYSFSQEAEYQEKLTQLEEINKELGIGVDKELEQAKKSETLNPPAEKDSETKVLQVLKNNTESDINISDNINENASEKEIPKVEIKKKKSYEVAI